MKLTPEQVAALAKRIADASEKFAIASFAIGVYQGNMAAVLIGLGFMSISLILTMGGAR